MQSIVSYGTYVPYWRLRRDAISGGTGRGTRSVASYDEDATSMAVEAARRAGAGRTAVEAVLFATASPPYLDKTNAAALHAALDLPQGTFVSDMAGSVRSAVGALRWAASSEGTALAVSSDMRCGLPGSADERDGGDGAGAFLFGPGPGLAEIVGLGSATLEMLDRWRLPSESSSHTWEERFAEPLYARAAEEATAEALKTAGIAAGDVNRVVVTGVHARAVRTVHKVLAFGGAVVEADLVDRIGNTGTAHPYLLLASALDKARGGEYIAVVVLADGADVIILRTSDALEQRRQERSLEEQLEECDDRLSYTDFLTWRGMLRREPPRRPDPDVPMAPPSLRSVRWKFGLVATRCRECGNTAAPPQRVCLSCGSVDDMDDAPLSARTGVVRTFTVDRLAFTPNPPLVVAVIDLDDGGRIESEVTDISDPGDVAVGTRMSFTFRRLYTVGGVHNYFWKARPLRPA